MEVNGRRYGRAQDALKRAHFEGALAYAYQHAAEAQPAKAPLPKEQPRPVEQQKRRRAVKARLSTGCRVSLFAGMLVLSAALLLLLYRYNFITEQYAAVNRLNTSISEAQRRVRALNVTLECAVSIQDAQDAAQSWGMTYPNADQYVRAGDRLPAQTIQDDPVTADDEAPEEGAGDGEPQQDAGPEE